MKDFTQSLRDVYISWDAGWFGMIGVAIWASPVLSTTIFGLGLLTAMAGRSLSLTLASALSGGIALLTASMPRLAGIEHPLTAVAICIQLLILGGIWRFRRRIASKRSDLGKLVAEKQAIQQHLEEEIRWRTAAESTEEIVPKTSPSAGE